MTFRLMTRATPLQIAVFNGRRGPAKPKKHKNGPKLVEQLMSFGTTFGPDGHTWFQLQLPLIVHAQHGYMRQHYAIGAKAKSEQIQLVTLACQAHLRGIDRAAISGVTFVRVCSKEMDGDNLQTAFKHVKDAQAAWIETGGDYERSRIGIYDGQIDKRTGKAFTWHYENAQHETNKHLQGIRIRLHLGSKPR